MLNVASYIFLRFSRATYRKPLPRYGIFHIRLARLGICVSDDDDGRAQQGGNVSRLTPI